MPFGGGGGVTASCNVIEDRKQTTCVCSLKPALRTGVSRALRSW